MSTDHVARRETLRDLLAYSSGPTPMLQNLPLRTTEVRLIRNGLVQRMNYDRFLAADYAAIEARIMAMMALET